MKRVVNLVKQVEENIARQKLFTFGARIIVAVSGGMDSMVLLHVLCELRGPHGWELEVAHFNHQLRGEASEADEQFVRETAQKLGLPFLVERGDVVELAKRERMSTEMAGRALRHRFLAQMAVGKNSFVVGLAHHADDQVETFWLRALRGDLGAGLGGMRWKRQSADDARVALVRPLLNVAKDEIADYAKSSGIAFREDLSNVDVNYQRNRVRHEILPVLEQYQPQLRSITIRVAEVLAAEKDLLAQAGRDWLESGGPDFQTVHPALQREIVRLQLLKMKVKPNFELIEDLRTSAGEAFTVSPRRAILRDALGMLCEKQEQSRGFDEWESPVSLASPGETKIDTHMISWAFVERRGGKEESVEYFDADAVGEEIVLRRWQPGDRFQPIGSGETIKLQDIFTNLKIPPGERRERLVGVARNGEIFWVEGVRIGEKFKVTVATKKILRWSWRHSSPTTT